MANLEEKLARIRGDPNKPMKYYASLDLSEAYHSVELAEEDKIKAPSLPHLAFISSFECHLDLKQPLQLSIWS